jgi:hypothetical protein
MTRAERIKIAHKACELLELGYTRFLCISLDKASGRDDGFKFSPCAKNAKRFYNFKGQPFWPWDSPGGSDSRQRERILAILFWAHCPESIRKGIE